MNVIFMPQQRNSCCNNLYSGSAPQRNKHLKHFEVFEGTGGDGTASHQVWALLVFSRDKSDLQVLRGLSIHAGHKSLEFRSSFIKVVQCITCTDKLDPYWEFKDLCRSWKAEVLRTCGTEVTKRLRGRRRRTLPDCRKEGRGYMMSPGGCDLTTRWAPAAPASQETPD